MKTNTTYYTTRHAFEHFLKEQSIVDTSKTLIQLFMSIREHEEIATVLHDILQVLPSASLIGATTDGEICNGRVSTEQCVISITQFKKTEVKTALIKNEKGAYNTGQDLVKALYQKDAKLLIAFCDGLNDNGDAYIKGLSSKDKSLYISGGMAGDGGLFEKTYVFSQEEILENGAVGALLSGDALQVHTDFSFDWLSIGHSMKLTKVEGNRVYTIDHEPAQDVYARYLGKDVARNLPQAGIEFPLMMETPDGLLARAPMHKHKDGSLSFAGDFSHSSDVTFGYGDADMIINRSLERQKTLASVPLESMFIYSCMARRRFMPNLIENETLSLQSLCNTAGFFTYGEFFSNSEQHCFMNQVMSVVGLSECSEVSEISEAKPYEEVSLNAYQKSIGVLSQLLNTTTQKLAQKNEILEEKTKLLKVKKASLRMAQEVGHFGSWEIDLLTKQSIWSEESFRIYKLDPETIKPNLDTFLSRVVEEDRAKAAEVMASLKDGTIKSVELRVLRADGVIINVLLNGKMIFNEAGVPVKMIGTTLDITEQVKLRAENEELATIIEHSSYEIYIVSRETFSYLYVNNEALKQLGYTRDEMLQMDILDINVWLSEEEAKVMAIRLMEEGSIVNRTIHTRKDGSSYPVVSYIQHRTYNGQDAAVIFDIDITDMIETEENEKRQAQILEQIHDSVVTTDLNDLITHWNSGATKIHGYTQAEMIGQSINVLYLSEDMEAVAKIKSEALAHDVHHDQIRKKTKSGEVIYTDLTVSTLRDEAGKLIGITRYSQNITQKKEIEKKLEEQTKLLNFQAYHDTLTKLPNRALFDDRLQQSIRHAQRNGESFALLFIDLDNFKQINDTLGHHFGDVVLKTIAERLDCCIRAEDTLSRWGGDEFTIILQDVPSSDAAAKVAQKIIDNLRPKVVLESHELHISASIGISLYPSDSHLKDDLLKFADSAMYKAKDEGKKNYQFYSEEMTRLAFEKVTMESNFYKALEGNEFKVFYQPQMDSRTNSITGMEALVRWEHPLHGLITPDKFIPLAEETGFIKELDSYVMLQAMKDVSAWYTQGLNPGILALNLSIKQLMSPGFVEKVRACIEMTGFDVKWLELEITESDMMHDPKKSIAILNRLSNMGIELAIDDFGTGYSSLAYLKRLPVDKLKIDQSFIQDIPSNDEDRAISKAVIALATSLNLSIIAEGVESKEQIEFLRTNGCFNIQGYFYSKAISQKEMTDYICNNKIT